MFTRIPPAAAGGRFSPNLPRTGKIPRIPPAAAHKRQLTDKRIGTMTLRHHFQSFVSRLCRLMQPYDDLRWERLQAAFAPTLSQHTQRRWPGLFNPALLKRDQRRNLSLNHFPDSPPSPAPLFVQARPLRPTTPPSAPLHQSGVNEFAQHPDLTQHRACARPQLIQMEQAFVSLDQQFDLPAPPVQGQHSL